MNIARVIWYGGYLFLSIAALHTAFWMNSLFPLPGITNYEEYSLIQETMEEKKEEGTGTLKKDRTLLRDERKMEKLKAKLHTDDDCKWKGSLAQDVALLSLPLPLCVGAREGFCSVCVLASVTKT